MPWLSSGSYSGRRGWEDVEPPIGWVWQEFLDFKSDGDSDRSVLKWFWSWHCFMVRGGKSLNNLAPKFASLQVCRPSILLTLQKQLWYKYLNLPKWYVADLLRSLLQFIHPLRKITLPFNGIGGLSALIENSCTINKISRPLQKVSIFAAKHKPLSKYFHCDFKAWIFNRCLELPSPVLFTPGLCVMYINAAYVYIVCG